VEQIQLLGFIEKFLDQLHKREIEDLYLVTNSKNSVPLFGLFGFKLVDKVRVPVGIASLEHFAGSIERENSFILNCQLFTRISTD
jgi:N-acetylglutamate synthase-like GNAT family acetyltransferase